LNGIKRGFVYTSPLIFYNSYNVTINLFVGGIFMFNKIRMRARLIQIGIELTVLASKLESVPIFWNFQYMKLPEESRKEIMGWMERTYELGIEEANLLLKLKKYDLYKQVLKQLKISEKNIAEVKYMCIQEGVSY